MLVEPPDDPRRDKTTAKTGSDSNMHTRHKQAELGCHLARGASQKVVGFRKVRGLAGGCLLS